MPSVSDILKMLRVNQWLKNACVFIGYIYSKQWDNYALLFDVITLCLAFCFLSSAVYIFNDLLDIQSDKKHPDKSRRPITSGKISKPCALFSTVLLIALGLIMSYQISMVAIYIGVTYLAINLAYSVYLKTVPVMEILCIASGFMLRVLIGTIAVGIMPSYWLLLCTGLLTVLLALSKRLSEIIINERLNIQTRHVLLSYSRTYLKKMLYLVAIINVIAYAGYCLHMDREATEQTFQLFYTVPFVIVGLGRYLYLFFCDLTNDDPVSLLLKDKLFVIILLTWFILTVVYLYLLPS